MIIKSKSFDVVCSIKNVKLRNDALKGGGIAQRYHSLYSPRFDSRRNQDYFSILDVSEINRPNLDILDKLMEPI